MRKRQLRRSANAVDVLKIPAFLGRQTDLLLAAAANPATSSNVTKGRFWRRGMASVGKIHRRRLSDVLVTERGASFGYNTLVSVGAMPIWRHDRRACLRRHPFGAAAWRQRHLVSGDPWVVPWQCPFGVGGGA